MVFDSSVVTRAFIIGRRLGDGSCFFLFPFLLLFLSNVFRCFVCQLCLGLGLGLALAYPWPRLSLALVYPWPSLGLALA